MPPPHDDNIRRIDWFAGLFMFACLHNMMRGQLDHSSFTQKNIDDITFMAYRFAEDMQTRSEEY